MTTTTVTIWHKINRADMFFSYKPGQDIKCVFAFALDRRIVDEHDSNVIAERCFAAFNGHPTEGWEPRSTAYYAAGNRSLSVGDVVIIGENAWGCAPCGFDIVSVPSVTP